MRLPYGRVFLLILAGCILGLGIRFYGTLKTFSGLSGFYYKEEVITREQVQKFWKDVSPEAEREIQDIVLFRKKSKKKISNPNLSRSVKGEVLEAAGNMNLIMPGTLMMGSFVSDSDDRGCVISKKTAEKLFSSYEVLGGVIYLGKEGYYIRGILDVNYEFCMIQGTRGTTYPSLRVDAPRLPLSVVEQQLAGILPSDYGRVSEGDLYKGIGGLFFWIPGWVLFFLMAFYCRMEIRSLKLKNWEYRWQKTSIDLLKYGLPVMVFAGICGLLLVSLDFTDDYIPAAWSDFSFWTDLFKGKWGDILRLIKGQLSFFDRKMLGNLAGVMTTSIIEGFLIGLLFRPGTMELERNNVSIKESGASKKFIRWLQG